MACGDGSTPPRALDGVWQTEGYGWIFAVEGDDVRVFEVTTDTCMQIVTGAIVARDPEPETLARVDLEVPGVFTLGMAVREGEADAVHFVADGLLVGPPAHDIAVLPERCVQPPPTGDLAAFDALTAWFREHYALLQDRDVDWDALVATHRPRLTGPTPEPFLDVATALLAPLEDAHVSLVGPNGGFEGRREEAEPVTEEMITEAQTILSTQYLVSAREAWVGGQIERAWLPGRVGYVAAHGFGPLAREDGRLDYLAAVEALEAALDEIFGGEPMTGLVLDLRTNGGGSDLLGLAIASRLTTTPYVGYTIRARIDPADASVFSDGVPITVTPSDRPGFQGPVAVLVGRDTVSAGETAALALRGRPGVTLYGERTQGAFSSVLNHFLPDGWLLGLPNEHYVTEAGERFDVVGLPPDVPSAVFSGEDLAASRDSCLDAALADLAR